MSDDFEDVGMGFQRSPWVTEHPEAARVRVKKEYFDDFLKLRRENIDETRAYILARLETLHKKRKELGREGRSCELLKALLSDSRDFFAYLKGRGFDFANPFVEGEKDFYENLSDLENQHLEYRNPDTVRADEKEVYARMQQGWRVLPDRLSVLSEILGQVRASLDEWSEGKMREAYSEVSRMIDE